MSWLWQAAAFFLIAVLGHALTCRWGTRGSSVPKFILNGCLIGLVLIGRSGWLRGVTAERLALLSSYAFLCELYLFFFTFVRSSISAALLFALKQKPLSEIEIDESHSDTSMVEGRVRMLCEAGFLVPADSGYSVSRKGGFLVASFRFLQSFFRHGFRDV